ncbi:MAG: hypothetical protein JXL80_17765 [Planctomycetes bacterium]|nr:hypothetical protein [Planctomycetota bacterium]
MTTHRHAVPVLPMLALALVGVATALGGEDDDSQALIVRMPDGNHQEVRISRDLLIQAIENWEPPLILKTYDVGIMLRKRPDYLYAFNENAIHRHADFFCGTCQYDDRGGIFDDDDDDDCGPPQDELLMSIIQRVVRDPDECWEDMGGRATIDVDVGRGLMFVSATKFAHKQIEQLLSTDLRPKQTTVTTHIMAAELEESFARQLMMGGSRIARTEDDRKELNKAIVKVHGHVTLSGSDGQALSANGGATQSLTRSVEPVVAEQSVAWDPMVGYVFSGFMARARTAMYPQRDLADGAGRALVDYRVAFSQALDVGEGVAEAAVPQQSHGKATYDKPTTAIDEHAGTVTLELDCPTIVAGGLAPTRLLYNENEAATRGRTVPLYYIVTVQKTGDDRPQAANAQDKPTGDK